MFERSDREVRERGDIGPLNRGFPEAACHMEIDARGLIAFLRNPCRQPPNSPRAHLE